MAVILPKDDKRVELLRNQVMSLVQLKGHKSLIQACKEHKTDYQVIYGQLNGYRRCYISVIETFVKKLDKKKKIDFQGDGTPVITFV